MGTHADGGVQDKYIHGGRERITIIDRATRGTPYPRSKRWIVWAVTTQTTLSEHPTRQAAQAAYEALDEDTRGRPLPPEEPPC